VIFFMSVCTMMKTALMLRAIAANVVDWVDLGCQSVDCSYRNPSSSNDMVVTMFFQVEDASNSASFKCTSGEQVRCQRSWAVEEQGSAGTCFFMLGSGEEFSCSGTGTITWIGSHAAPLAGKVLTSTISHLACEGGQASDCAAATTTTDQWVELAFKSSGSGENGFRCDVDGKSVCHYTGKNTVSSSSCGFLVPQGSALSCTSLTGSVVATSATTRSLSRSVGPTTSAEPNTCPPSSTDPTLCNCDYANTEEHDMLVSISASNADNAFNSFHCWVGSSNTCAWGVNNGQTGWAGTCYFILPAGAQYSCAMQFGATAFPEVTVVSLSGSSMFPKSSQEMIAMQHPGMAKHVVSARSHDDVQRLFAEYTSTHGNTSPERFENFRRYVAMVDNHPSNSPLTSGSQLSSLAVLSVEEFESSYRGCAKTESVPGVPFRLSAEDVSSTPTSIDWRTQGAVTPVKDQGQCGSCWAFSTTGVLEGAWAAGGHGLESLSEQHLVSCDNNDGNLGCDGGWPYKAVDFVRDSGIDSELSYPYTSASGTSGSCASSSGTRADIQVASHVIIDADEDQMAAWVAKNGPVSISIDAMTSIWWSYTGGIVSSCCNHDPDHAVLVTGFGEENGQKYWWVKNSWGENWGEQGYIRLERGSNQCGITYQPVGVVISGAPTPVPPPSPLPSPVPPSPTPTPPTPPTPPGNCPTDAESVSKGGSIECLWSSGTGGLTIPSSAREYCTYISSGYLGYTWPSTDGDYSCAPSARKSSNGDTNFCVWEDGNLGVSIPSGSLADCDSLSQGRIGFIQPALLI